MQNNVIKLWKTLLQLASLKSDKGELIIESELVEGVEVYVEKDGEFVPAEDGEYTLEDEKKVIVISEGKVAEIREIEEPEPEPEPMAEPEPEPQPEPEPDERDARIAELEAKVAELEALVTEKDNRIAELESQLNAKDEELKSLQMSTELPAKDKVKETKTGALRYF